MQHIAQQVMEIISAPDHINLQKIDEALATIDSVEHAIYAEIHRLLRGFDPRIHIDQQTELFTSINELNQQLCELTNIQASLIGILIKEKHFWCKEKNAKFSTEHLSEIYHYFIQHLRFETNDIAFKDKIFAQILKLMSKPNGQDLIYELERQLKNGKVITIRKDMEGIGFKTEYLDATNVALLTLPENPNAIFTVDTKGHLIQPIYFICLGHELVHIIHFFDGTYYANRQREIREKQWNNFEEFVTIQVEYQLCFEHELPYRYGHETYHKSLFSSVLFNYQTQTGNTNFAGFLLLKNNCAAADFSGYNFTDAQLRYCNFRNAVLRKTNFEGADLRSVDLRGANLSGANLRGANLEFALIDGTTNLTGAIINETTKMRFIRQEGDNIYLAEDFSWIFATYPEQKIVAYIRRELETIKKDDHKEARQIRLQTIKQLIDQLQYTELQSKYHLYRQLLTEYGVNCSGEIMNILEQNQDPYLTINIFDKDEPIVAILKNYCPSRLKNDVSRFLSLTLPDFKHFNDKLKTLFADLSESLIQEQEAAATMIARQLDGGGLWSMPISIATSDTSVPIKLMAIQQTFTPAIAVPST